MTTPKDYTMKYQGKNPLEKLREGEPYFFLRAQDALSTETVQFYADLLKRESDKAQAAGDQGKAAELLKQALGILKVGSIFADWQYDNKQFVKLPD
jgi:hypothetical protein